MSDKSTESYEINPYEFELGDKVYIISAPGIRPLCTVLVRYLSDRFNHPAKSHIRYLVQFVDGGTTCDVCYKELVKYE